MAKSRIPFSISGDPTPGYKNLLVGGKPTDYKDDNLKFDQNASQCDETFVAILGKENYDYCLIMRPDNITSYTSSRGGALNIVLTIPSGKCIIDYEGKEISPAKVLICIKDHFANLFMEKSGCKLKYLKAESGINAEEENFCEWLNKKYQLKDSKVKTIAMNPYGPEARMVIDMDKIEELFLDTAYPELKEYSKLIAVTAGNKDGCLNLEIPRPKPYKIEVRYEYNGNVKIKSKELDINGTLSLTDEYSYQYADFYPDEVTLDQIRELEKRSDSGCTIDDESNKATVRVIVTDKEYPITLKCTDENGNDCAAFLESITLKSGNDTISVDKKTGKYIAKGNQIKKSWEPKIDNACGYEIKEFAPPKGSSDEVSINVKLQKLQKIEVKFEVRIKDRASNSLPIDLILKSGVRKKTLTMGKTPSLDFKGDEINNKWKFSTKNHSGYEIDKETSEIIPYKYKEAPFVIELFEKGENDSLKDTGKKKVKYVFWTPKELLEDESLIAVFRKAVDDERLETVKIKCTRNDNRNFELEQQDGYELHDVLSGVVVENWKIQRAQHYNWTEPQENRNRGEIEYELVPANNKRKLNRIAYLSLAILSIFAIGFLSGGYTHHGTMVMDSVTVEPIVHVDTVHDTIIIKVLSDNVERAEVEQNVGINGEKKTKPEHNAEKELEGRILEFLNQIVIKQNKKDAGLPEFVRTYASQLVIGCNKGPIKTNLEYLYLSKSGKRLTDEQIIFIANKIVKNGASIAKLKDGTYGQFE